jgi:regulator of sigma E protease
MAIISAGVIMNVIFAVLMASWAFGLGVRELTCQVSGVRPGGAAWRAGLRTGDEITAIGALKDPIFSDLQKGVTLGDVSKGVEFTIRRPADGSTRTLLLRPDTDLGVPTVGVTSPFSLTLPADLKEGLPGAAGRATPAFEAGDTIRAIDGVAVETYAQLVAELAHRIDKPVRLTVSRRVQSGSATTVEIELPPQMMRTTGMVMTPLAVKAVQDDSPASRAGIRPGDRIVAVDGVGIGDPLTLDKRLQSRVGDTVKITVTRADGATEDIDIVPRAVEWLEEARWPTSPVSISTLGVAIGVDALVAAVVPDSAAAAAGIVAGDRVVRVRFVRPGEDATRDEGLELSEKSPSWPYVKGALQQVEEGTTLALDVEGADGSRRDVSLTAVVDPARFVVDRGLLFEPVYKMVRAGSIPAALRLGFRKAIDDLSLVYKFLHKLTVNQISPRLLGGPIEIAKQAGKSAEEGFSRFLLFLTMLSANLAVVNFLPIPVLDGGHMVFLVYEWLRGKPPSEGVVAALSYLGLALILTLMMFVFGLDLGLIPRR